MISRDQSTLCFVVEGAETYGVQRMTLSTIKGLNEQGTKCIVVALRDGELLERCREIGAEVQALGLKPPPNYGRSLTSNVRNALSLYAYTRAAAAPLANMLEKVGSPPVVVRMPNLVPLVAKAAWKARAKSYWIAPNVISSRYPMSANKVIYEYLFARYKLSPIANSCYTATTFPNIISRAKVLYLGVDKDQFVPLKNDVESRRAIGFDAADIIAGVFARMVPEKGQDRLIRALALLGEEHAGVKLLLAGSGDPEYELELKRLVHSLGLTGRVVFLGALDDLPPVYALCDFVVNSRIDAEPFGLSVIEAMMMERPVLAHRLGGPGETVIDDVTGWLMPNPSVDDFSEGLRRALADRHRWSAMGAAARLRALEHFESRRVASNLKAIVFPSSNDSVQVVQA